MATICASGLFYVWSTLGKKVLATVAQNTFVAFTCWLATASTDSIRGRLLISIDAACFVSVDFHANILRNLSAMDGGQAIEFSTTSFSLTWEEEDNLGNKLSSSFFLSLV